MDYFFINNFLSHVKTALPHILDLPWECQLDMPEMPHHFSQTPEPHT